MLRQYSKVMHKINVMQTSFLTRMDGTEKIIRKYFVLVRHQKLCPKEVNNCYTRQRTKGQNMVNYQLW